MEREVNQLTDLETRRACVELGTAVCPGLCGMVCKSVKIVSFFSRVLLSFAEQLGCCKVKCKSLWRQADVLYWLEKSRNAYAGGCLDNKRVRDSFCWYTNEDLRIKRCQVCHRS